MSAERVSQLIEAGLWLRLSGDADGARRLFEQALAIEPLNPRVQELLDEAAGEQPQLPEELQGVKPPPSFTPPRVAPAGPVREGTAWDEGKPSGPSLRIPTAANAPRDALDVLSDPSPPPFTRPPAPLPTRADEVSRLIQGAQELLQLDNHSDALDLVARGLLLEPENVELLAMRERSERTLQTMYESKLGDLNSRPRVLMRADEVIWLNLDHRAGFVLAQIDGTVTFEELFLVSGMSRLDTARILAQLKDERVIGL